MKFQLDFTGLLAIVFITMKLMGHITWSWWWVLSPLWLPIAFVIVLLIIFGILKIFDN